MSKLDNNKAEANPQKPVWAEVAKLRMKEIGVTQEDLIEVFGVSTRGAVGHYFTGRREPTIDQLINLKNRLGITMSELVQEADSPEYLEVAELLRLANREKILALKALLRSDTQKSSQDTP